MNSRNGFTLIELLVSISVIAILAALSLAAMSRMRALGQKAYCANSLRQLGAATQAYLAEHEQRFFYYSQNTADGTLWYFGLEPTGGPKTEGSRVLDQTQGPLYPYVQQVGGVQVCPAFPYDSAMWKPKFKGASWGYGFNTLLSNVNVLTIDTPSRILVFGDCAQVNTFQAPATAKNPLVEEFYMIDTSSRTVHFRHGNIANVLFIDGHVEPMNMYPGTQDTRLKSANVGRITPAGSTTYLK